MPPYDPPVTLTKRHRAGPLSILWPTTKRDAPLSLSIVIRAYVAPVHFRAKRTGSETFSGKLFKRFDRTPSRSTSHPPSLSSDRQGSKEHETPIVRNPVYERPLSSIWFQLSPKGGVACSRSAYPYLQRGRSPADAWSQTLIMQEPVHEWLILRTD
jgi:hypothetical protein